MEKKLMTFIACLFLSIGMALAQTQVSGTVTSSEDGSPVIGASIKVVGTNTGTVTNIDGNFSLNVSANAKLEVSYIGMVTKTVKAAKNMKIVLDPDNHALDEVMVVAYGTQKKSAFTGSAAIVDAKEIGKVQVTNAVDALKGKAAGVQIYTGSGQPGATPTIRIRGFNSKSAGNDPLIVLDGSPFSGSLNDINPADVESMTVLKDASSTALYGARGGNGVILITTKSGQKGTKGTLTVDAKWGSNSKAVPEYETMKSPAKYYEMWYKALNNYAQNVNHMDATQAWKWANDNMITNNSYGLGYNVYTIPEGQQLIGTNGKLNPNATLGSYSTMNGTTYYLTPDDWIDEIYNNSLRQEYTVTATGASDRGTFYGSANYLSNDGITAASNYRRFTSRLKADYQVNKWLKVGANMSYGHFNSNSLSESGDNGSIFATVNIAPIYPMYMRDANGNIIYDQNSRMIAYDYGSGKVAPFRAFMPGGNPISDAKLNTDNTEGNTFNGTGFAEIQLPYGFKFTSINNVYLNESRSTSTTNPYFGQYAASNGVVNKEHDRTWSYNYQQRINWHQVYGKHDIEVMLGHEYYRVYGYGLLASKHNQFSVDNKELAGAVVLDNGTSSMSEYNTESWLSRAMYNYDSRYFGSVSVMRQASSRFAKDNWWGTFWSFGAGWNMHKESWFKVNWIDELKLKASYGENGNDAIGSYMYTKCFAISNSNNEVSLTPSSLGNPKISWEKNGKFNIGVDFSLLKNRIWGSIEYYNNTTSDMLSTVYLPVSYGWSGYFDNIGNMVNRGVEIDLHADAIRTKDFTWNVYVNMTTNHNEITKLSDSYKQSWYDGIGLGSPSGAYFYQEGKSLFTYYTKKYAGVDPETGLSLFYKNVYEKDENNKDVYYNNAGEKVDDSYTGVKHRKVVGQETTSTYNDGSNYLCGDVLPDVYGGFGTSVAWKGLDFSMDFQYQIGGQVYDGAYASLMDCSAGQAIHVDMEKAWTPENTNTSVPRWQYGDSYMSAHTDRFLTNASYLTLSNITLGYTLPTQWMQTVGLQKVRVYMVADNIWTWSKRQGLDPRQSVTGGSSNSVYRPIRTISGGITVTF